MCSIPFASIVSMAWLPDAQWLIPLASGAAFLFVIAVGWRFLVAKPAPRDIDEDGLLDAHFLQGVTQDRRATPRRKGNIVEVALIDAASAVPTTAWVHDRSFGGLCIMADQPIPPGTALRVRPRKTASTTPWSDIIVRSCRKEAGQYELGCQFRHTPNWNLLLMFG